MKPVHEMTAAELVEEARRRDDRRRRNLPLTDESVLSLATRGRLGGPVVSPATRTWAYRGPNPMPASGLPETKEQKRVFSAFRLAGADKETGRAYWLSQPRASKQTPGVPDLLLCFRARGVFLLWETKVEGGEISDEQWWLREALQEMIDQQAGPERRFPVLDYGMGDMRAAGDWLVARGWAVYDAAEPIGVRIHRAG